MLRDARWAARNAPVRLASMTLSNRSSVIRIMNASWEMPALDTSTSTGPELLDLGEGTVDGLVVGDVAHDAEQTLGRPGSAVGDGDLVPVGGQPPCDRQADAPVAAGHQDRAGHERGDRLRTPTQQDLSWSSTYRLGIRSPKSG